MKRQNGFALALVILVLLLVTTISIPLILSSTSTNNQVNKVEEVNENKDESNIILDLIVSKYKQIVEDENTLGSINWTNFQITLDSRMSSYISNDLNYDSTNTTIDIQNINYSGNTELISREVTINSNGQTVSQKVNFNFASTGSGSLTLPGISAGNDIQTDGYLDLGLEVSANNILELHNFSNLNLNNGVKLENYSNKTQFLFTNGSTAFYDDLSSSNQAYVRTKINFNPFSYPGDVDMEQAIFKNILEDYGRNYETISSQNLSYDQIFDTYLDYNAAGWQTYSRNTRIRIWQLDLYDKVFVNGDLEISLHRFGSSYDIGDKTIIATGDITFTRHRRGSTYVRTISGSSKFIAGDNILLDGAENGGNNFNALLLAGNNVSINNESTSSYSDFVFQGVIHANNNAIIKNEEYTSNEMYYSYDSNVLNGLTGGTGTQTISFTVNPKQ